MQSERRTNPYPYTWEIPLVCLLTVLVLIVIAVHAGTAAANLLTGNGPHWPAHDDLFTTLPGILIAGDSSTGLPIPAAAPRALLWGCVAVAEALVLTLITVALVVYQRRWGRNRVRGMASRAEAATLLGAQRLRKVAPIVRPDLYGTRGRR